MAKKKIMYTIFTEDEGRADWVTNSKKKAQAAVDRWYEEFFGEFGYNTLEKFKETGMAYVVELDIE